MRKRQILHEFDRVVHERTAAQKQVLTLRETLRLNQDLRRGEKARADTLQAQLDAVRGALADAVIEAENERLPGLRRIEDWRSLSDQKRDPWVTHAEGSLAVTRRESDQTPEGCTGVHRRRGVCTDPDCPVHGEEEK